LHGKYRIATVLGNGGFGITYLAEHEGLAKKVVIKEFFDSENAYREVPFATLQYRKAEAFAYGLSRFEQEAQLLAQFEHGNIVRVQDCFRENGTAYFVMPYYEGETLAAFLNRNGGTLDEESALKLFRPIIDGLNEAHRKGILHRDIKPDNIYLVQTEFGGLNPILIDFGSSRYEAAQHTKGLTALVTPHYAPIEQYSATGNQGKWTDIYALCATLYKCLTGKTPPEATERAVGTTLPLQHLSPKLATILEKGLSFKPEERFQILENLVDVLYLNKIVVSPKPVEVQQVTKFLEYEEPESDNSGKVIYGAILIAALWFILFLIAELSSLSIVAEQNKEEMLNQQFNTSEPKSELNQALADEGDLATGKSRNVPLDKEPETVYNNPSGAYAGDFDDYTLQNEYEKSYKAPLYEAPPSPTYNEPYSGQIFEVVERMPEPIGGIGALQSQIVYPEMAKRAGISGRVVVQFEVSESGIVSNPVVLTPVGGGCDEEAVRVISNAIFTPGMQKGKPVKVKMSIPIRFRLN
jgi:TonB family protein